MRLTPGCSDSVGLRVSRSVVGPIRSVVLVALLMFVLVMFLTRLSCSRLFPYFVLKILLLATISFRLIRSSIIVQVSVIKFVIIKD